MPVLSTAIGLGLAGASAAAKGIGSAKAAGAQASGAQQALNAEQQAQRNAIQTQQPYTDLGTQSANNLAAGLANPGAGLLEGFNEQFTAPTLEQAQNNPGYQFALQQGTQALDQSAAAKGNLFSGTQGKALQEFGQQLGEQNYQQVYNNAMNEYLNRFNIFNTNQSNEYNRLMGGTQVGQNAANTEASIYTNSGQQQAQQINNAAAARASGYAGVGDAVSGGLNYGADVALQNPFLGGGPSSYAVDPSTLSESSSQLSPVLAGLASPVSPPTYPYTWPTQNALAASTTQF